MAEWSTLSKETPLDCIEVEPFNAFHGLLKDHADVDDSADHDKVKQKSLFDQLFSIYLNENCSRGIVRPLPVLLGDGQMLDLYQLFSLVKEKGGYGVVSEKRLWHHVTKELGLDLRVWVSVKLVYDKYLSDFEGWLKKTFEEKRFKNENRGLDWGFKSLPIDLEKEFRSLLGSNLKDKDADFVQLESSNIMKHIDLINHKSDANVLDTKRQNNKCKDVQHVDGDDDEKICNIVKNDLAASLAEIAGKEIKSRKRKRETLPGMLNWMRHVATHPLDHAAQPLPKSSKLKECKGQEPFSQILRTRDVLALKDHGEPNGGPSSQKLKMHPAMYEDEVAVSQESPVKSRSSERLPVKSRCSCSDSSCSANGSRSPSSANVDPEKCPREKTTAKIDLAAKKAKKAKKIVSEPPVNDFSDKKVSIGPRFQADVPEWTGVVTECDSKWLGTQLWPAKHDTKPGTQINLVGSRRREKCNCYVQGSVECVRFHMAENRMKLKLELGPAFFHLGFDQMGEEVTLRWTPEEEKKFKDVMRTKDPDYIKAVRKNPSKYFRKKTTKDMVSYYFNVFVVGLRSYQNRVTPKSIDSDDDEEEFGSCGASFGMRTIQGPASGAEFLECSENKQCTDMEE